MSQKFVYLHIGQHKTATTYIQKLLAENFDVLKREFDLLYPKTGRKGQKGGHHDFSWSLLGRGEYYKGKENFQIENLLQELEVNNAKNIVISAEDFEFLASEKIKFLHQILNEDFCVIPILYLRNWLYGAFSKWQERIKGGSTIPFSEFFDGPLQNIIQNQKKVVENWSHFFGEQIQIVIYDNLKYKRENPLIFLMEECLNIPISKNSDRLKLVLPYTMNSSFSPEKVEFIKQLNIDREKNFWKTINIDNSYENFLRKAENFKQNYTFFQVAGKNVESLIKSQNSVNCFILNNYYERILNPHSYRQLFINEHALPNFEVLPNGFYKKYLELEENYDRVHRLKTELQNFC
jgi:hypothetical protein